MEICFCISTLTKKKVYKIVFGLPPQEVERLEGEDPTNPKLCPVPMELRRFNLENWQMAHFRVLRKRQACPIRNICLEPARRIWRQLTLLEGRNDGLSHYKVTRARVFKIDVGGIAPQDVEQYMQKVMTQMKRHQVVDDKTGRVDLRYNPLSIEEGLLYPH